MKISELVYECIRDSITIPNTNFSYDNFINKDEEFTSDSNFVMQREAVFSAINLALTRLNDYNKLPLVIERIDPYIWNRQNAIALPQNVGELINMFIQGKYGYKNLEYREWDLKLLDSVEFLDKQELLTDDTREIIDGIENNDKKILAKNGKVYIKTNNLIKINSGFDFNATYSLYDDEYNNNIASKKNILIKINNDETIRISKNKNSGDIYSKVDIICSSKVNCDNLIGGLLYDRKAIINNSVFSDELDKIYIEYKQEIPHFSDSDILPREEVIDKTTGLSSKTGKDNNLDLRTYGINNSVFTYIKEFVKGQLYSVVDPKTAELYNQRAENYFSDLPTYHTQHAQQRVAVDYGTI